MLEKLSAILKKTTDKIANAIFLDKNMVESIIKDLQRALLEADVNVSLVLELTKKIKKAAFDERIKGIEKKEHIIKLLHDELIKILGKKREIKLAKNNVFLMAGLYGSGKTTTIAKLAMYYAKRGNKVCALGLDTHRPAASEQLKQLCDKINIKAFIDKTEKDPKKIWKKFQDELKNYSLVLIDTAGRDSLDNELIKEIRDISKLAKPTEILLVMPADIGQAAKTQAEGFKKALNITGVIITRMDSTAKGGGALTACAEVQAPVIFIGTGEKLADLEPFNPESFLSRLLGMGDLQTLIEKVHSVMSEDDIKKTQAKLREGKFTMYEFEQQIETMGSMGSMDKILSLIPGLGKIKEKIPESAMEQQQAKIKNWKAAIKSMTPEEKEYPEILEKQTSRIQRIAKGAGISTTDVRMLIKQFKLIKEMIKSQSSMAEGKLDQKTMMKLARKFGKKIKF
ncbi:MAG: signal recognition particle receptor subunit alpha [Candidatus Pacearchaeota archaeon]